MSFKKNVFSVKTALIFCATIGLAPFSPEPHIWGKIKWIAGGATNMQTADWLDVLLHGSPWVYLLFCLAYQAKNKFNK